MEKATCEDALKQLYYFIIVVTISGCVSLSQREKRVNPKGSVAVLEGSC